VQKVGFLKYKSGINHFFEYENSLHWRQQMEESETDRSIILKWIIECEHVDWVHRSV